MTTLVTVDNKSRIILRGAKTGEKYLVKDADGGWFVMPVPDIKVSKPVSRNRREWAGSKKDLVEHLETMRAHGFRFKRTEMAKQLVPPCRF